MIEISITSTPGEGGMASMIRIANYLRELDDSRKIFIIDDGNCIFSELESEGNTDSVICEITEENINKAFDNDDKIILVKNSAIFSNNLLIYIKLKNMLINLEDISIGDSKDKVYLLCKSTIY